VLAHSLTTSRRLGTVLACALMAIGLLVGPMALPAHAEGKASTFDAKGNLSKDGVLTVKETVTFDSAPATLQQRFETRRDLVGDRQYVATLSDISALVKGAAVAPEVSKDGRFTTVSVPMGGATDVVISYTVRGAVVNIDSGTALQWPLLQGLNAQVGTFTGSVQIPAQFSYIKCLAGSPNSTVPCDTAAGGSEGSPIPKFGNGALGEGQIVSVDIGFPPHAITATEKVDYRWTVGRAFSASPLPLSLALGLLVLGAIALILLHRRSGIDANAGGQLARVGEFVPTGPGHSEFRVVGDIRPGHVGTVADERVDPIDVTATVVDLAVRGHLLITELPRATDFGRTDWELTRLTDSTAELQPFERALLEGLAAPGSSVLVSDLASRVHESIDEVQNALYDEVVSNGWYERRPDAIRNRWTQLALGALIIAVVITGVLAAFTTFGLVGLALVILTLGLVFVGQEMPSRTAKGAALLGGLTALRSDLLSHPTDQMTPGTELREISEVLPYAIVLGGTDRWLDAVVATDDDDAADSEDLHWYHGPANWHLRDLPDSMKNFVTTVSGSLFTR
jgi:hypothetical protein